MLCLWALLSAVCVGMRTLRIVTVCVLGLRIFTETLTVMLAVWLGLIKASHQAGRISKLGCYLHVNELVPHLQTESGSVYTYPGEPR